MLSYYERDMFFFKSNYYTSVINGRGRSRGEARGAPPPLVLDQIEARLFFETAPPPSLSKGLDDAPPPPRPLYLKFWIRH